MKIRQSAEDYLETILRLREEKGYARSIDIAVTLGITKPSVSVAMKRLREIVVEHEPHDHTVGIFAHGAVLRTMLAGILQMPLSMVWCLSQYNTAVNLARFDEGRPTVELLNSTAHLALAGLSGQGRI